MKFQTASTWGLISFLAATALFSQGCGNLTINGDATNNCLVSYTGPELTGVHAQFTDNTTELAVSFQLANLGAPSNVQLRLLGFGSPTGTMIVKIEGDSSGPNGV